MSLTCNKPGCTLNETGKCALENDPLVCPDRLQSLEVADSTMPNIQDAPIQAPRQAARFSSSFTLNLEQVNDLMQQHYCRMIGILGPHGAGKTACLVSSYLLLAHNILDGFTFRNSKTIRAFEEISMGARWVAGQGSEQLTTRTEIADERTPGFLHLRIERNHDKRVFDLVLPDLPGEWTNSLVDTNRTDRMSFLKSADHIWIVVNGADINDKSTRRLTLHRIELILQRVASLLELDRPPVSIVVTHKDRFTFAESLFQTIIDLCNTLNFDLKIIPVASFSESQGMQAGEGLSDLLHDLLTPRNIAKANFWPDLTKHSPIRHMLEFGKKSAT